MKKCLKCGYIRTSADRSPDYACPKCQAIYAKVEALHAAQQQEMDAIANARRSGNWSGIDQSLIRKEAATITLVTTESIPGMGSVEAVGIVSADYAYAFGAIFESIAGLARNVVGSGASGKTVGFLKEGRTEVMQLLRFNALDLNANAVVGVRFEYEEFSGANNQGVIVVTATGTALRFKRDA
jgi:uncharacterized protein YbjQ (UPF0145 family)